MSKKGLEFDFYGSKYMNKKAFTLIELLAIIVILAIIAVITVPIILNVIDNAEKGSIIDSAYGYKEAVQKFYVQELAEDTTFKLAGVYTADTLKEMGLSVSGLEPSDGWVQVNDNQIIDFSIKIEEWVCDYNDGNIIATKNGTLRSQPVDLTSLNIGDELSNFGGYDWHVIGSTSSTLTLLMDAGENGSYKLPADTNLTKDSTNKVSKMAHCTTGSSSNCTWNGRRYVYSWDKSLISEYLNRNTRSGDFLYDLRASIGNIIVRATVCNDPSMTKANDSDYSYGGYLMSDIPEGGCNSSSDYSVRLISSKNEYDTLKEALGSNDKSWLYSNDIGFWWSMSSYSNTGINNVMHVLYVGSNDRWDFNNGEYAFVVRPVITISK